MSLNDLLAPTSSLRTSAALALASAKKKTLEVPLPLRARERVDREAAYERTKEEVDVWEPAMRRIRAVSTFVLFGV